jgi:hypothetical protein
MKHTELAANVEAVGFLRVAEELIEGKPVDKRE